MPVPEDSCSCWGVTLLCRWRQRMWLHSGKEYTVTEGMLNLYSEWKHWRRAGATRTCGSVERKGKVYAASPITKTGCGRKYMYEWWAHLPLQYAPDYGTVCCVKACLTEEDVDDKCDGTGQECALRNGNTWVLQISRDVGSSCYS